MAADRWEFWIDIGGTFTDCLAKAPNGEIRQHKLLSSGVTKGHVGSGSSSRFIFDPARASDPAHFWNGWNLVVLDDRSDAIDQGVVTAFDAASHSLQVDGISRAPLDGAAYELRSELDAAVVAIRYLLGLPSGVPAPPVNLRLGTTRGTNALLTRTGARTAFITTRGFGDTLEIGYQTRPRLFDLTIRKPSVLACAVVEIDERVTHDGRVLIAPRESKVRKQLSALFKADIESLAICLLHADRHPEHEQLVEQIAREVGFREISVSHVVAPLPKFVARADTTVVDAYLNPVLREYFSKLAAQLPGSNVRLLTSAGGLVAPHHFRGKDSILSGPAGGVVGFSRVAQAAGFERAIGFDMGGTSTDVSRFDGRYELEYETQKAGIRLVAPTMAIETVAAGGGSICRFDGAKLGVGPESAGADPGPACYGRGGPLTVTDVNLYLGRIVAERFPIPLNRKAAEERLQELSQQVPVNEADPLVPKYTPDELAEGLLRIANANMASAIRSVTIAKGADPAAYVLVAFGGAAGQHACAVARELGIKQVLIHPQAGLLSALGIGLADVTRHRSCGIERPLSDASIIFAKSRLDELEREAIVEVCNEGVERFSSRQSLDLSYSGQDEYLTIDWPADGDFHTAFASAHRRRYGYVHERRPLTIVAARVEVVGGTAKSVGRSDRLSAQTPAASSSSIGACLDGRRRDVPVYDRGALTAGTNLCGPAIVIEDYSTIVIETGWEAGVMSGGEILLSDSARAAQENSPIRNPQSEFHIFPDPVLLEIFNNHLSGIAEQMGITLRNTASSVNVKERLDFSCAVFTADGRLVANAPHVPVHLGAMEETVRAIIAANANLARGDVIATNDPYGGGSHLPDVTVITPMHDPTTGELRFFMANRAHHAEIGGITPGSMPPRSTNLAQEGVLLTNFKIVAAGESRFDALRELLSSAPYPSRDPATNLADIAAQIAANKQGAADLTTLVDQYSWPMVERYMDFVQQAAERKVRQALAKLPVGKQSFTDYLLTVDGTSLPICVQVIIHPGGSKYAATIDFTGTAPPITGNLNANRAIVTAAVLYVLRVLIDEDIPLNHGALKAVEIVLPTCLLNPKRGSTPETTPGIAAGNVETSQRVVDVLLGALGVAGASQGTMNNVIFGDESFGYYETICGGSGATAGGPGASAVQVHMTNTRITDPEIFERRYPARLLKFSVRRGSGGAGKHRGGDGVVRRIEFLHPVTLSLLTQRRGPHPPYGMAGGEPGALGHNQIRRADGTVVDLAGITQIEVAPGDLLKIETPGGGGYGSPTKEQ
ncbi:MAG TPA: hydantoinase B/oxoprolinase family protein [Lacipirellulaceae bacterium]|nr:hydantoinase B/oxoprolinase family protein [Lacipirellulaceae bacterium]